MKRILLLASLFHVLQTAASELVKNSYASSFDKAYALHPEIPRGMLEAVAFCNSRFEHITHASTEPESCTGIPNAYGVMGLTLDGKGYFFNNLQTVADLSKFSVAEIIAEPEKNILAYADAFAAIKKMLRIKSSNAADQLPVLAYLSELPRSSEGQIFAFASQQYGYLQFLTNPAHQRSYGFPDHHIDIKAIYGEENYAVLSAITVRLTDESVTGPGGQRFQPSRVMASSDYAPALWAAASSCNYSSRSGVAVSAVTIHTVQGSYSGCISWFQNCSAGVSAHYVLRSSDGQVTQMVLESQKAWHVGSENPYTIGLEHEGYISTASWYTTAMYTASANLVRDITTSGYGINPLRTYYGPGCSGTSGSCALGACTRIKGHQMFPMQSHTDPGPNWNWARYYLLINNSPSVGTLTASSGTFTDNGGSSANYTDDQRTLTLIQPPGATSVTLTFSSFNTEANWDYLFIYDGASTSAPLIGMYDGTSSPGTVISTGGSLLVEFRSDCATTAPGWVASWTSNAAPVVAADSIAPATTVSTSGAWQTADFTASFSDADNPGGSGLEKSYYQVIDFNGTEWRANAANGFFADNFDVALHPDWTNMTGSWSIVAGALHQSDEALGNTNTYAALNQSLSNRYLYNFYGKIDGTGTNRRAGFHFFCDDGSLINRGNSYFVWFRVDDSLLQVYETVSDVFGSPVLEIPFSTVAGQWYDYKIIYDRTSGKISIYRDNQFIADWTDPSPIATGNAISFRSGNASFSVNELKVYRSRTPSSVSVSVGTPASDIRFQNPNPTTFSAKVKSICADSAGNLSPIFYQNINVDWTAPSTIDTINDGTGADISITNSATDLSANWSASADPHSAIARYWYAIGSSPGATDILGWTDNWYSQSVTVSGLSLIDGQTYYFSVKAEDGAGLQSAVFSSNGQTVQLLSTGVEDQTTAPGLLMQPNPFTGTSLITYQLQENCNVELSITDLLGRTILLYSSKDQAAGKYELPVNAEELQLARGMYFIRMSAGKEQRTIKTVLR